MHVEAGIPAWDVLVMATNNAARSLKMEDRTGRIAVGMEADILFLEADPSLDIRALARVAAVMENGRLHRPEELKREAAR